jgi:hypothetical protein
MWKNSKFVLIFLAELVLIIQITLPYKYIHYHCNHTGPGTTEKHGDSPNEANRHCHAPRNLIHIKTKSFSSNPKSVNTSFLFVILFTTISKIQTNVQFANFSINDNVILKQYHSTKLSFRGPPAVA